jgi:hypothetical protein
MATEIAGLRTKTLPELVRQYQEVFGKEPRVRQREYLWKRIAWKLQEQRFGGLSNAAKKRLDELIAEIRLPPLDDQRTVTGRLKAPPPPREPGVGSVVTRQYKGREIAAKRLTNGYEYEGVSYKSLTAVAFAVTGQHWNGRLFFGLSKPRKRP